MKKILFLLMLSISMLSFSVTKKEAYNLVRNSIIKHNLADVNCIAAYVEEEGDHYNFDIHANNAKCGGDAEVMPRLFSYQVNKQTGKLKTDSFEWFETNGRDWDGDYIPID